MKKKLLLMFIMLTTAFPVFAEKTPHPANIKTGRIAPSSAEIAQIPTAESHGHYRFQHVRQNDHSGQRAAEGPVEVGQPRVAAAVAAHIIPQDILGNDDRSIKAAAEIGHRRQHKKTLPARPCDSIGV